MEKLAKLLNQFEHAKILDVGTGTGNFIELITSCYKEYDSIIGIDTTEGVLNLARENFDDKRIVFRQMNGNQTDYPDNYFDIVCLSNSLHHLDEIKTLFKEMKRIVKTDGIIIVAEMISNDLTSKQMSHLKIHHFAAKTDRLKGDTHNETYTEKEINEVLRNRTSLSIQKSWLLKILGSNEEEDLPDRFKWFEETVSRLIKRIPKELQTEELKQEGQEVVKYIQEHGFDTCPTLIVVMKK